MTYSEEFIEALKEENLGKLRKVPKSDLHNHLSRAAKKQDLEEWLQVKLPSFPGTESVTEMDNWYRANIKDKISAEGMFPLRIKSAFSEAKRENITKLCLSFGPGDLQHFHNELQEFINTVERYKNEMVPQIVFIPELSVCRTDNVEWNQYQIDTVFKLLEANYFRSIDIVGGEKVSSSQFRELFEECRNRHMQTKSHIGEFTPYTEIERCMKELPLTDIQHGISASENNELMARLREEKITLHICPTSNVMLHRTEGYHHPQLRKLLDAKVPVTINTDDLLIFDSSISEEYLHLYHSGDFSAEELDTIRLQGI